MKTTLELRCGICGNVVRCPKRPDEKVFLALPEATAEQADRMLIFCSAECADEARDHGLDPREITYEWVAEQRKQ